MDLTSEQRALRESVAGLLQRHQPSLDPSGPVPGPGPGPADAGKTPAGELWRLLTGIEVAGLAIPEPYGGAGASQVEVNIVAEELGRALAPSPLLGSAVLTAQAILRTGDTGACERLLPRISTGTVAALAWTGRTGGWDPEQAACHAATRGGGWTLTGTAHYVLDGDSAQILIVAARMPDGSVGLFEVAPDQPGVDRQPAVAMDQTRPLAVVRLAVAADRPLRPAPGSDAGTTGLAWARDLACVTLSAEQVGAAARALELTANYTKARVQFGRPIASFQAVQHRLAELHALVESARSLSYRAAAIAGPAERAPGSGPPAELRLAAAAAKAYCSDVLSKVAAETIQLHGAIGVTWEYDAHRYFKRAHGSAQLFGPPTAHLARIADAVIDG